MQTVKFEAVTKNELTPAEKKVVRHKMSLLELAETLGNVTKACKMKGVSRTQFYEYKRRFQTHGLEGLRDLPPIHKSHPMTTPPETVEKILEMSLQNPMWGCIRLSNQLKLLGISVSSPTIQNILIKHEMGSKYQRLLKLEAAALDEKIELTPEQVKAIEKANPCFKERHVESSAPRFSTAVYTPASRV
jgi:transposase